MFATLTVVFSSQSAYLVQVNLNSFFTCVFTTYDHLGQHIKMLGQKLHISSRRFMNLPPTRCPQKTNKLTDISMNVLLLIPEVPSLILTPDTGHFD